MRIVELVNNLEFGGTERLVVDLTLALHARGHELHVVCLRGKGPLAASLERAGVHVLALQKPEGPNLSALREFTAFLKRARIEVVHTHNPLVHHYGVVAGKLAGVPAILNTIHGIGNIADRAGPKEWLYWLSCLASERVVAVCAMAYRTFVQRAVIPHSRLVTINNGIPLEAYLAVPPRTPDDEFVFGIVGRLVPVKDHRSLLEAFALVLREKANCRLEILGDGPERGTLEQRAAQLGIAGQVHFRGFSNDVAGFLSGIDVDVLCSVSEGLPLGVLEAMAAARPIVCTSVGGLPDLVEGAQCGWLAPPSQPQALGAALLAAARTSTTELRAMGQRAREHAATNYSLQRMSEEHEQLFAQLLDSKGHAPSAVTRTR